MDDYDSVIASRSAGSSRTIVWLTLAFWLSNLVLANLGTLLSDQPYGLAIMAMRAVATLFGLMLCYLIHRLLQRPFLNSWRRRIIFLAIVAPIAAECFAWVNFFAIMYADPTVHLSSFTWSGAVSTISFFTWFFLAWAGMYLALIYSQEVREERLRSAELLAQAHAAQLRAIHSQINPHFLFNSLNSLSALILDDRKSEAECMVSQLSEFLRMGLSVDPNERVTLAKELALQRRYLDIERARFPDLKIRIDVPAKLESALVPSLILQPLVENAVKHGVATVPTPAEIRIRASDSADKLTIEVLNDRVAKARLSSGAGIGLRQVAMRLDLLYGTGAALTHGHLTEGGYSAQIALPLETV